ncbi:TPA: phage major capsid protein, partial [Stenotrophomonas maltophilia]|nr:phage major capsid protein [Stenotrophomonas maltophilia]HDS1630321.1 phage major capsid protein [Stenotrophomonas maltophilia]
MPFNIQAERERRTALAKETRNLLDTSTGDGNKWTPENQAKYDNNIAEIERIDAAIERHQKVMDLTADEALREQGVREHDTANRSGRELSNEMRLFDRWARGGDSALSAEDWKQVNAAMSGNPAVNPEQGGYTVPTTLAEQILEALKAFGGMRQVADVFSTAGGEPMQYPTSDGTSEEGELVAENQSANDQDVAFGT